MGVNEMYLCSNGSVLSGGDRIPLAIGTVGPVALHVGFLAVWCLLARFSLGSVTDHRWFHAAGGSLLDPTHMMR